VDDETDIRLANPKSGGDSCLGLACRTAFEDFAHLYLGYFRAPMRLTARVVAMFQHVAAMALVLAWGTPLKITGVVVCLYAVDMIGLVLWRRAWA
jgi:hypothetical protein